MPPLRGSSPGWSSKINGAGIIISLTPDSQAIMAWRTVHVLLIYEGKALQLLPGNMEMFLRIAQQYLWFQSLTDSLMIKLHDLIIWHFKKDTGNQQWLQRFYFRNRILAKRQERGAGKSEGQ